MDSPDSTPSKPTPARPADAPEGPPAKRAAARPEKKRARPTPVRQSLDRPTPSEAEAAEPEILERSFTSAGAQWTARVVGRAGGAHGSGPLPLLQLEFRIDGGDSVRSAVIAGTCLGAVSEDELIRTLQAARSVEAEAEP